MAASSTGPKTGRKSAQVWAVGGGKGGTGKSFLTSSIGLCLASMGHRVVMLDADLGGANLHSFLGIKRPRRSLTEFFENSANLDELVVGSGVAGVGLVTGDLNSLATDSVRHVQKLKLFRQIRALDADYVMIDLGSGAHYNTLDAFIFADRKIVVMVPEITSIENMYQFIKNTFFRKLMVSLGRYDMKEAAVDIWKNRESYGIRNLKELVGYIKALRPEISGVLDGEIESLGLDLVVNQVRKSADMGIGNSVRSVFSKVIGLEARYAGYVEYDDAVLSCTNKGRPFLVNYPTSRCAKEVKRAVENLLAGCQMQAAGA